MWWATLPRHLPPFVAVRLRSVLGWATLPRPSRPFVVVVSQSSTLGCPRRCGLPYVGVRVPASLSRRLPRSWAVLHCVIWPHSYPGVGVWWQLASLACLSLWVALPRVSPPFVVVGSWQCAACIGLGVRWVVLALGSPRPCWVRWRRFEGSAVWRYVGLAEGVGLAWDWRRVSFGWSAT
jgi:hypothetical protein